MFTITQFGENFVDHDRTEFNFELEPRVTCGLSHAKTRRALPPTDHITPRGT